jgi:uncharacterized protein (DUF58 family)
MIIPTRKLLVILLVPAAVMLAWRTSTGLALGLGLDFAVLFMAIFDLLISPRPRHIQIERLLPAFLSLGGNNLVGWRIRNNSRFTTTFSLTEDVPIEFVREKSYVTSSILPHAEAELRYGLRPTRRGLYDF